MVQRFARTARERIRIDGEGYRRNPLRALAQRVEVADREVRILGLKTSLWQTLTAAADVKPATPRRSQFCSEMAEREGFEPPEGCPSTVFKTAAFDRSATSPGP